MSLWRQIVRGLDVLVRREGADRDLEDELQLYIDEAAADHERRGLTPGDARRAARVDAGNFASVRDELRESGWEHLVFTTAADLRYALRQWRANPGFTVVVVASLALGIGATTAIYSAVRPVLFNALPYPDADRLVKIAYAGENGAAFAQTFGTFCELEARARRFDRLAVFKAWQPALVGAAEPERIDGQRVTAEYFRTLQIAPALGTDFNPSDDRPHGPNVVILSDALWRRRFAADPGIIGRQITLDDQLFTTIGVMPPRFEDVLAPSAEAWTLLQYDRSLPPQGPEWGHHLQMMGRLTRGTTTPEARREIDAIARNRIADFPRQPQASMARGLIVTPLHEDVTREIKPALFAVAAAVVVLLAIACVNVANLLAARSARRRGEFAMRVALGADRRRLLRQLLTESVLLAAAGGALGVALAGLALRTFAAVAAPDRVIAGVLSLDRGVVAVAGAATALVGVLVGIVPALSAYRGEVRDGLHRASHSAAGDHDSARRVLVAAEVALSVVLLVAAGLLLRSIDRLFALPVGFEPARLLAMQVQVASLQRLSTSDAVNRFYQDALEAVRATPSVAGAAFTSQLPLSGDDTGMEVFGVEFERHDAGRTDRMPAYRYTVTPGYFETMRIPLRRGRLLIDADRGRQPRAVVISESFARRVFGTADALGQRVRFGGPAERPWDVVVGVVGDVKQSSLAATEANAVYVNAMDWLWADNPRWLVVRAKDDAAPLVPATRRAIWSVDKDQPIVRAATMDAMIAASEQQRRYVLAAFEAFGFAALALAAIGIYGVVAASVAERTREIGVRAALGASAASVAVMVVRRALTLTAAGVVCGLAVAAVGSRAIAALLFGTSALDPLVYAGGAAVLFLVAGVACCLPAYRAANIDPAVTLRAE